MSKLRAKPRAAALAANLQRHAGCDYSQLAPISLSDKWRAPSGLLDPLVVGVSVSDCLQRAARKSDNALNLHTAAIAYPLLAVGVIGNMADLEDLVGKVSWRGVRLRCWRGDLHIAAEPDAMECERAASMRCRVCEADDDPPSISSLGAQVPRLTPRFGATHMDAEIWRRLEQFAARTYVEPTEAARLVGAGAGLRDND